MNTDTLFSIANSIALVSWILLVIVPRVKFSRYLIGYGLVPAMLSLVYVYGILTGYEAFTNGGYGSIREVRTLFSYDAILLAGWVHYLAFDLLIGGWIVNDSAKQGFRHWHVIPALVLTFLVGPVGFALYFAMRTIKIRKLQPVFGGVSS